MKNIRGALGLALALACLLPMRVRAENWGSTSAEELGITQTEFKKVKETGMSRVFLLHLLEIGVTPNQYFGQPWKQLGVTEDYWLNQKRLGMRDDDFNRAYRRQQSADVAPFIAFVLPGYYHYQTHRTYEGVLLSTVAVGSIAVLVFDRHVQRVYPMVTLGTAMIWSAADAFINTRFADNQDAKRFSFNLQPESRGGEFQLALRF